MSWFRTHSTLFYKLLESTCLVISLKDICRNTSFLCFYNWAELVWKLYFSFAFLSVTLLFIHLIFCRTFAWFFFCLLIFEINYACFFLLLARNIVNIFGSSSFLFAYLSKFSFALKACYGIFLFHYLSACSLGCMECRGREEKLRREVWLVWHV